MTIDEAIKEFTDWAKDNRNEMNYWLAQRNENDETSPLSYADCEGFARDKEASAERYEQLAEWLTELKEVKRLLKLAVEDFKTIGEVRAVPTPMIHPKYIEYTRIIDILDLNWRYTDKALKLIGDE